MFSILFAFVQVYIYIRLHTFHKTLECDASDVIYERSFVIDNIKRNAGKGSATSVVFHTSVPYGVKHVEQTVEQVQPELVAHFEKMFPHWPKPDKIKCQKWRYSQV